MPIKIRRGGFGKIVSVPWPAALEDAADTAFQSAAGTAMAAMFPTVYGSGSADGVALFSMQASVPGALVDQGLAFVPTLPLSGGGTWDELLNKIIAMDADVVNTDHQVIIRRRNDTGVYILSTQLTP